VIERRRAPDELDGFSWYCENCGQRLFLERVAVRDIETQLPEIFSASIPPPASHLQRLRDCHAGGPPAHRLMTRGSLAGFAGVPSPLRCCGPKVLYFGGHSLGLQPKPPRQCSSRNWRTGGVGVMGHHDAMRPWIPYQSVRHGTCRPHRALESEVVA